MATKPSKSFRDESLLQPARASQEARSSSGRLRGTSSQASKKSFLEDDFFSKLPAKDIKDEEGSSASSVDTEALLQTLKDVDTDLQGLPKPSAGPGKTTVKGPGKCDSLGGEGKTTGKLLTPEKGESVPVSEKKSLSSPSASRQYKKFNFGDIDDPLAGLLSDEEQDAPKKLVPAGTKSSSEEKMEQSKQKEPAPAQTPQHTAAPARRRAELTFEEDDNDDLMEALGFGSGPKADKKQGKKAEGEELRPARSKLDELLGQDSVAKVLEQPGMGEHREFKLDKKYQKPPEKEEGWDKDDFVFGGYQPTVASMPKSQLSRRQSVSRFSAENISEPKPEPRSRPPPPASQSPAQSSRTGGHWLGLKDEDLMDSEPLSPAKASPTVCHPSAAPARMPSSTSQLLAAEEAVTKPDPPEEEDWLTAALARKKAQAKAKAQEKDARSSEAAGGELDPCSPVSQPATSTGAPQQAAVLQDNTASTNGSGWPVPWLSPAKQASVCPSEAAEVKHSRDTSTSVPTALFPGEQETQGTAPPTQVTTHRAHLQATPQLQAESSALGLLHERRLGAPTAQPYEDASGCWAALLSAQARIAELESKVQILELERTRHRLLLESLQQQHQEDLDLLKSAHRAAVQEMRRDHEEQLQRLKRLKEQEIEAVTSTMSHTRSLNGVVEQMEKLCSDFHDLSHKMEAMHHTTCQELSSEARQRDKQLKVLQDRMSQQQRDMEGEWSRLQEVITKMEARLSEQTRLLEQERRRAAAEQSKVESLQHSLEEQRRDMTQQLSMERAELERAKEQAELQGRELKAKEEQLVRDRELLDKAWQELRLEKEKVNRAVLHVRQQEEEIKSTAKLSFQKYQEGERALQLSSQKYEEGERALQEACRRESEEQSRLQAMQQQLEKLTQYEQQLQQERLSMAHQRRQLEKLCEEVSVTRNQDLSAPRKGLSSMQFPPTAVAPDSQAFVPDFLPPLSVLAQNNLDGYKPTLSMSSPSEFYTKLLLLKYQAQQDHADLENVRLFLESLKKDTYNTSSLLS